MRTFFFLLFLAVTPALALAQSAAELGTACSNEISLFCEGQKGAALVNCLRAPGRSLMKPCRTLLAEAARAEEAKKQEQPPAIEVPPAPPEAVAAVKGPQADPAIAKRLTFNGAEYIYRRAQDNRYEFTPQGEEDIDLWSDMVSLCKYPGVTDEEALAFTANQMLEGFKQFGGMILKTDSVPRTSDKPAEHLVAAVYGRKTFLEAVFARVKMYKGTGYVILYSHRIHGARVGDPMSAWLEKNGPEIQKVIMAWDGMSVLAAPGEESAGGAQPAGAAGPVPQPAGFPLWALASAGGILSCLAGFGVYRFIRSRRKKAEAAA